MSTFTSPPSLSAPRNKQPNSGSSKASMFENAVNPRFENSSFNIVNNIQAPETGVSGPLRELYGQVAPHAILNAGGRADEVKCYPGTREEVMGLVEHWMDGQDGATANMMWLSGPAGAGKSAIVQTIAERCKKRGVPAANFFFFRGDPTRRTARPLVATLLYQILEFYPPAQQAVATILAARPLLLGASIQDQFNQLLSAPLQDITQPPQSPARRPIVLLIDGLDECDSEQKSPQRQLLQALDRLVMQEDSPFLVLVASRAEPHITMAVKELASPMQSIFLDDQYKPEKDIRVFVAGEFSRIKKSHHISHTLGANWPSDEDIESIVKKSSGQFIYAATVMRYLSNSSASPKLSLERVQGIAPVATNSPFAHLDAIYTYILSQADDQEAVMDLLSMDQLRLSVMLSDCINVLCEYNPRYNPELLESCVSDLTAILQIDRNALRFFHASFPDFLEDKSRAGEYYIDMGAFAAKVLPQIWMKAPQSFYEAKIRIALFNSLKTATSELTMALLALALRKNIYATYKGFRAPLRTTHRLITLQISQYYPHDIKSYKKILHLWISASVSHQPGQSLSWLESRSLPYVEIYYRIAQIEYWATRPLKALFPDKLMKFETFESL